MKNLVWGLVILLVILHQDIWFWYDDSSVMGFIPIGLFYHALISVGAGVTWYLATVFAWPEGLDNVQPENEETGNEQEGEVK